MSPCRRPVAVVANRMIAPVAVIGPRVDLAVNDPIELCAGRVLLRRGARDEGSGAEDDPPAATSLARLNVTRNPRLSHRTRAYRQPHSECPRNRGRTNAACSRLGTRGLRRWECSSISASSTNTTRSPKRHARTSSTRRRQSNTAELTRRSIPRASLVLHRAEGGLALPGACCCCRRRRGR